MMFLLPFMLIFFTVLIFGFLRKNKVAKIIGAIGVLIPCLYLVILFLGITFLNWD